MGHHRTLRLLVLILLLLGAGAATGWFVAQRTISPEQAAAAAAPPEPSTITASVERRELSEQIVFEGTVVVEGEFSINAGAVAGVDTRVITAVHVSEGQRVDDGQVIATVSARPLIVAVGEFPMYRPLNRGLDGPDVEVLQRFLVRRGVLAADGVDGDFGRATEAAVSAFYASIGFDPVQQGSVEESPSPGGGGGGAPGLVVPVGEIAFVDVLPATISRVMVEQGSVIETDPMVLSLFDGSLSVEARVPFLIALELEPGGVVAVRLRDGTTVDGKVSWIADAPEASESGPRLEVRIELTDALPIEHLGEPVEVISTNVFVDGEPLVVPLTAVNQRPDGTTFVVRQEPDGSFTEVEVQLGASAGGLVAVDEDSPGLSVGDLLVLTILYER